ncbi:MAG: hypothetical protein CBB71_09270 [Rhodopirellula sp. TMED11]|nr:MAG: hypothetical protein CBB71_09270 [Rhodopirellula sp. TMED11]
MPAVGAAVAMQNRQPSHRQYSVAQAPMAHPQRRCWMMHLAVVNQEVAMTCFDSVNAANGMKAPTLERGQFKLLTPSQTNDSANRFGHKEVGHCW